MIMKKKQNAKFRVQLRYMKTKLLPIAALLLSLQISINGCDSSEIQPATSEANTSTLSSATMDPTTNDSALENTSQPELAQVLTPITSGEIESTLSDTTEFRLLNDGNIQYKGKLYSKSEFSDLLKQNLESMYIISLWSQASFTGQMTSTKAYGIIQNYVSTEDKGVSQSQLPLLLKSMAEEMQTGSNEYLQSISQYSQAISNNQKLREFFELDEEIVNECIGFFNATQEGSEISNQIRQKGYFEQMQQAENNEEQKKELLQNEELKSLILTLNEKVNISKNIYDNATQLMANLSTKMLNINSEEKLFFEDIGLEFLNSISVSKFNDLYLKAKQVDIIDIDTIKAWDVIQ